MNKTTFKLSTPIDVEGAPVETLELREPNIGDMEIAMEHQANPVAMLIHLVAQISNHQVKDIRQMSMTDVNRLESELGKYLNFPSTQKKPEK